MKNQHIHSILDKLVLKYILFEKCVFELIINYGKIKGECRFKNGKLDGKQYNGTIYKISSFIWVNQGDDQALMEVLDKYGPVAVAIDASNPRFTNYHDNFYGSLSDACNITKIGI